MIGLESWVVSWNFDFFFLVATIFLWNSGKAAGSERQLTTASAVHRRQARSEKSSVQQRLTRPSVQGRHELTEGVFAQRRVHQHEAVSRCQQLLVHVLGVTARHVEDLLCMCRGWSQCDVYVAEKGDARLRGEGVKK